MFLKILFKNLIVFLCPLTQMKCRLNAVVIPEFAEKTGRRTNTATRRALTKAGRPPKSRWDGPW